MEKNTALIKIFIDIINYIGYILDRTWFSYWDMLLKKIVKLYTGEKQCL